MSRPRVDNRGGPSNDSFPVRNVAQEGNAEKAGRSGERGQTQRRGNKPRLATSFVWIG